jgi:general L-amino acid transport system permease protein
MPMTAWLRANLFRNRTDSATTIVVGSILVYAAYRFLRFLFITGRWEIVRTNLPLYLTGSWPEDELWRIVAVVIGGAAIGGMAAGATARRNAARPGRVDEPARSVGAVIVDLVERLWPAALTILLLLVLARTLGPWLLVAAMVAAMVVANQIGRRLPLRAGPAVTLAVPLGVVLGLWFLNAGVGWNAWGGLLLNLALAAISITLCFPLGVLLALGRRSSFPIVRVLCTVYIEVFRGVPLIALLLLAAQALGFFVPQSLAPGDVVRAIVVFTLFTAAYVAEIVRGGLQSVPPGQIEAGKANGLTAVSVTRRIVLPQAIRNVIPALVGQFISLFKDTTLAGAAMGFTDLLSAAEASTKQDAFAGQGLIAEALVFVLLLFWAGSYTMSRESQRLEGRLGVGVR